MDDDPMAYLNAKRKEMEAIAEMAAVAQMQHDLAQNVSSRMEKINSLLETPKASSSKGTGFRNDSPPSSSTSEDPEVEYWRKKLAELSAPVPGVESSSHQSPYSSPSRYHRENGSPLRSSPHFAAVLARDSSNAERHKLLGEQDDEEESSHHLSSKNDPFYRDLKVSERLNLARSASKQIEEELNASPESPSSHTYPQPLSPPPRGESTHNPPKYIPSPRSENEGNRISREDPEVEYWRKKIAELSGPSSSSSGYHSSSLPADMSPSLRETMGHPPPARPNLRNPRYKAHSLADEPLSWEGTASYAAEHSDKNSNKSNESPPSSPSSAAWRSQVKQLFHGDDESDHYSK